MSQLPPGVPDKLAPINFVILSCWIGMVAWLHETAKAQALDMEQRATATLRKTNIALLQLRDRAEAASRAKSSFLATVSHEMRTPLHGVIGMTSLLLAEPINDRQREHCRLANQSAETLLRLIDDILDLSKIEAGRLVFVDEPYDVRQAVQRMLDEHAESASRKFLRLSTSIGGDVPRQLRGDAGRIGQVVSNLVSNAIKFTDTGSVSVKVGWQPGLKRDQVHRYRLRERQGGLATGSQLGRPRWHFGDRDQRHRDWDLGRR